MDKPTNDPPARTNPSLVTPKEASRLYPISVSLFYQLCDEKRLAHVRVGGKNKRGKILLRVEDIERFIQENRIEAR